MECQPVAPSGTTSRSTLVCWRPVLSVARTWTRWSPVPTSTVAAHCTQVSSFGTSPSSAATHGPPSTDTSTAEMPVCWAQADPPKRTAPAETSAPDSGTSMRERHLDRPFRRPAPGGPVGLELAELGDFDVHQPLGGRHVAVEPGNDHPHGEPVLDHQRLSVHPESEHRVSVVRECCQRGAAGPAVGGGLQDGIRTGLDARFGQHLGDLDPTPPGVADQIAAHRIGHTVERDPVLGELARRQRLVGQFQFLVDQPVDAQHVFVRGDRRQGDGRVDQIELVIGSAPGLNPFDADLGAVRNHRCGDRQLQQLPRLLDLTPLSAEERPQTGGGDGRRGDATGTQQETASVRSRWPPPKLRPRLPIGLPAGFPALQYAATVRQDRQ